jgi:hypothetical protein
MIFGMLLAGLPETQIAPTIAIDEHELARCRTAMLAKLDAPDGGMTGAGPGRGNLDFDRLIQPR